MSVTYPASDPLVNICDPPENQLNYAKKVRKQDLKWFCGIKQKVLMKWYGMKQQTKEFKSR